MKILKIESFYIKNNKNINFKSKPILTNVKNQPKIDMFCKSNEVKSVLMENFIKLRNSFSEKLYPILKKYSISEWNFYINSTDENLEIVNKNYNEYKKLWQDENLYKEFLKLKNIELNKHEKKQLNEIDKIIKEKR